MLPPRQLPGRRADYLERRPRDENGSHGPYEASLLGNPVADAERPLEVLRTVHFVRSMSRLRHSHV
ncbi:MAG: nickel-dependent hydrogenase large subunit [Candidatus Acidiferrum sp.]